MTRRFRVFDFDHRECWKRVQAVCNEPLALRALDAGMSALCRQLKKIKDELLKKYKIKVAYKPRGDERLIIIGRTTA